MRLVPMLIRAARHAAPPAPPPPLGRAFPSVPAAPSSARHVSSATPSSSSPSSFRAPGPGSGPDPNGGARAQRVTGSGGSARATARAPAAATGAGESGGGSERDGGSVRISGSRRGRGSGWSSNRVPLMVVCLAGVVASGGLTLRRRHEDDVGRLETDFLYLQQERDAAHTQLADMRAALRAGADAGARAVAVAPPDARAAAFSHWLATQLSAPSRQRGGGDDSPLRKPAAPEMPRII